MPRQTTSDRLDQTFFALADPTRRAILERLERGEARVTEIAEPFDISLNAVSKHLKVLERAGLIRREVRGRVHVLSFSGEPLERADDYLERFRRFWQDRLDALEEVLRNQRKG